MRTNSSLTTKPYVVIQVSIEITCHHKHLSFQPSPFTTHRLYGFNGVDSFGNFAPPAVYDAVSSLAQDFGVLEAFFGASEPVDG